MDYKDLQKIQKESTEQILPQGTYEVTINPQSSVSFQQRPYLDDTLYKI